MMTIKSKGWKSFLAVLQSQESAVELDDLLHALLTPEERDQVALRVELLKELLKKNNSISFFHTIRLFWKKG